MKDTLIRLLLAWSLIATCLLFMKREAQKPLLVYHADSKYQIMGKVFQTGRLIRRKKSTQTVNYINKQAIA